MRAVTELTLEDGARVEVRAVEPSDRTLIEEVLEGMSPESRYRRFLTAHGPSQPERAHPADDGGP